MYSNSFSKMTGAEVYIKAENLQKTGSFKVRGAFNKMTCASRDVVVASMGNHAQAVAFAAGNILDVVHDRFAENLMMGKTRVVFIVETRSREHLEKILSDIVDRGFAVIKRM
jgi:tryptophan synthase beta subunit